MNNNLKSFVNELKSNEKLNKKFTDFSKTTELSNKNVSDFAKNNGFNLTEEDIEKSSLEDEGMSFKGFKSLSWNCN